MPDFFSRIIINKYWLGYWILSLLIFVISILNIKVGHYLIGWDNLQVELNYWENLRRSFFAAWQEYQGLGLASGHAHAVETIRLLVYLPAYILLPNWFFRYFFHLSMLFIGSVAVYSIVYNYLTKKRLDVALVAGSFYLLNIGTVQIFYAALEPFSAFWAFFPLSLYYSIKYLYLPTKKNYIWLIISQLLLTISYQIQTFAVVYMFTFMFPLGIYFFYCIFKQRVYIKRILLIFVGLFFTNLYWIGSAIYFFLNNSDVRFTTLNNKLGSEDAFLMNVAYSNFNDIFLIRGFWFGNVDYNNQLGEFGYMMEPWAKWWGNPLVTISAYVILAIMLVGLLIIVQKQRKIIGYFIYLLFISLFFLFNIEGPLGYAYQTLVNFSPTLKEIFRFPFTKWAAVYVLSYTIFFSMGYKIIADKISRVSKKRISKWIVTLIVSILVLIYSLPIFRGQLFYDRLELVIPSSYFKAFSYLSKQDKNYRIMNLPQNTFWGWFFTDWGYRGSGFIWWGISQPIADRAFDVWNPRNEQYYTELHYAIYSKNKSLFEKVVQKYNIGFIWIDDSVIVPNAELATQTINLKSLMKELPGVSLVFEDGNIHIYQVQTVSDNWSAPSKIIEGKRYDRSEFDPNLINNYVDYYSTSSDREVLSDEYLKSNINEDLRLTVQNPYKGKDINISFPTSFKPSNVPVVLSYDQSINTINFRYPAFSIIDKNNQKIYENTPIGKSVTANLELFNYYFQGNVLTEPIDSFLVFPSDPYYIGFSKNAQEEIDLSNKIFGADVSDCSGNTSAFGKSFDKYPGSVIISGLNGSACLNFEHEFINSTPTIYKVSFDSYSDPDAEAYYCLYKSNTDECLNKKYERGPIKSSEYKSYVDYVFVENPSVLSFHLANESRNKEGGNVYFRNIKVTAFAVNEIGLISLSDNDNQSITLQINADSFPIKFDFTDLSKLRYFYSADSEYYKNKIDSCDRFRSGLVSRELQNDSFFYRSINGTSCDALELPQILPSASYLVNVNSQNVTGKAIDVCIAGQGFEKCMVQDRLRDGSSKYILPEYPNAYRYYIDLRSQSYGNQPTENILNFISLTYIPYNWLKAIAFEPVDNLLPQGQIENGIKLVNYNKEGFYKYRIFVNSDGRGELGYIKLNQSYDNGWILYNKEKCGFLGDVFPQLCPKISDHVLANNWANGWIVPNEDAEYVAVFWPQYLQFYGFGLFALFALFVVSLPVLYLVKSKKRIE